MNFEDLQKAWQSQDASARVTFNTGVLLQEVRRNQQQFRATIFWRDVREIGVAFLMALFFSYHGLRHGHWTPFLLPNWDFILLALACAGVGIFMLVDRIVRRRKQTNTNDPLKACIETSLNEVNHQIWLLQNIVWWYLLPLATALAVNSIYSSLRAHNPLWVVLWLFFTLPLYWGIYRLNKFAVRKSLEPRRQELETLLASVQ